MIKIFNKNSFIKKIFFFLLIISLTSCNSLYNSIYQKPKLVDTKISKNAKILHKKLFYTSKKGIAIGHQDATSYGIGWKQEGFSNNMRSDVQEIVGDLPAVFGFDIGHIELGKKQNLDSVSFDFIKKAIMAPVTTPYDKSLKMPLRMVFVKLK